MQRRNHSFVEMNAQADMDAVRLESTPYVVEVFIRA
jgi:hypothetical protein